MTNGENESEDSDYVLVGQSEEPKKEVPKGPESLKDNVSLLVVDINLLLSQPEVFKVIVFAFNWSIVTPVTMITKLFGLTNSTGLVGDAAKAAAIATNKALTDKRGVNVVNAKGSNVTNIGFYKEQVDKHGVRDFRESHGGKQSLEITAIMKRLF
ncbi:unnamed protein product [Tuber melanosporum]|uniref:(Perigord truffle) hypothetical protein n=1 Tax=Tuber melanosporum (strain Mel28) TaxID=656061 RepID=D5GJZ0_TUBMM|nr:uncharacterized protein GSTUM_00009277001 [Tuber melanosporum]CAZ84833.1 unnamed protein product [Tuber melanosporum]